MSNRCLVLAKPLLQETVPRGFCRNGKVLVLLSVVMVIGLGFTLLQNPVHDQHIKLPKSTINMASEQSESSGMGGGDMAALKKVVKLDGAMPTQLEKEVAKAIMRCEVMTSTEAEKYGFHTLKDAYFHGAIAVEVGNGKVAVVIEWPMKVYNSILMNVGMIQSGALVREMEKKLPNVHVCNFATRRTIPKPRRGNFNPKAEARRCFHFTKKWVLGRMVEDIMQPCYAEGARSFVNLDGTQVLKTYLPPKFKAAYQEKLHTWSAVFFKLTGQDAVFSFDDSYALPAVPGFARAWAPPGAPRGGWEFPEDKDPDLPAR